MLKLFFFSALPSYHLKNNTIFPVLLSWSLFQPSNNLLPLGSHIVLKLILAKVTNEKLLNPFLRDISHIASLPSVWFLREQPIVVLLLPFWPAFLMTFANFSLSEHPCPSTFSSSLPWLYTLLVDNSQILVRIQHRPLFQMLVSSSSEAKLQS